MSSAEFFSVFYLSASLPGLSNKPADAPSPLGTHPSLSLGQQPCRFVLAFGNPSVQGLLNKEQPVLSPEEEAVHDEARRAAHPCCSSVVGGLLERALHR